MKKGTFTMLLCALVAMSASARGVERPGEGSLPAGTLSDTSAVECVGISETIAAILPVTFADPADAQPVTAGFTARDARLRHKVTVPSIYSLPYSMTTNVPDWHRLWTNTAVFAGAFGGTLLVLQCLPEDATSWNRAELQKSDPLKRWYRNVFVRDPEIDHDKFIFNYVLHPYAGAVYFMAARSSGFNFWRSFLYCSIVSDIGWEFGVEACMERPSYQDLVITPVVGSVIGECFYRLKRRIVDNGYRLGGSPVLGNVVAFLIDPVNEVVGYFGHSKSRHIYRPDGPAHKDSGVTSSLMPSMVAGAPGFTFSCTF